MSLKNCVLVGVPIDSGKKRQGCLMGPDAFRTAGMKRTLEQLGHTVVDWGNVVPAQPRPVSCSNGAVHSLEETVSWSDALRLVAERAAGTGFPIFLGGDHALSIGSVAGIASHALSQNRPLFVLWLDAHTDLHTLTTTKSGNLHGTSLGYISGLDGFDVFGPMPAPVPAENICLIGLRSVDGPEKERLTCSNILAIDMRTIDEGGVVAPLSAFLDRVAEMNGLLHVSFDVDFLDPSIAPAVGTSVPGGVSFREAHLVMEMLHESGLVASLDLVELNPFLDERGRTASVMLDLTASLFGRRIFDRHTPTFL